METMIERDLRPLVCIWGYFLFFYDESIVQYKFNLETAVAIICHMMFLQLYQVGNYSFNLFQMLNLLDISKLRHLGDAITDARNKLYSILEIEREFITRISASRKVLKS
jgi:hypothetical protein